MKNAGIGIQLSNSNVSSRIEPRHYLFINMMNVYDSAADYNQFEIVLMSLDD